MCAAVKRDGKFTLVTFCSNRSRRLFRRALGAIEIVHIPERGIWTSVGLSREQFFIILLFSILFFLFLDGPAWRHLRDSHTLRIAGSYGIIPALVAFAQWRRGCLRLRPWVEASILISLIKLLLTAILLIMFALLL
jgi:hypothetical protein